MRVSGTLAALEAAKRDMDRKNARAARARATHESARREALEATKAYAAAREAASAEFGEV